MPDDDSKSLKRVAIIKISIVFIIKINCIDCITSNVLNSFPNEFFLRKFET